MNCGIEVLKRLNEIINVDLTDVIKRCEAKVTNEGLSMYDLVIELNTCIPCQAVASLRFIRQTPFIAFIGFDSIGHYVLVERIDDDVWIFDPAGKLKKCSKLYFYLIWSKKAIYFML